jgi:hypothetical protein
MRVAKLVKIPPCTICGQPAKFDAPGKCGHWAYMCRHCFEDECRPGMKSQATMLELQKSVPQTGAGIIVIGGTICTKNLRR